MNEKPILFSAPMVRAILEGRKTQTRRDSKFQSLPMGDGSFLNPIGPNHLKYCPYGQPGDRLWVRETFEWDVCIECDENKSTKNCIYKADGASPSTDGWKPSIFMPRWASRITLEIINVRIERLQDISEEDAIAEGIKELGNCCPPNYSKTDKQYAISNAVGFETAKKAYRYLWEQINGHDSWNLNPWVWVIEFKKI